MGDHDREERVPLFTPLTFDLTITSLFAPLVGNGSLTIIPDDGVAGLHAVASDETLTWAKATPSHLEAMLTMR